MWADARRIVDLVLDYARRERDLLNEIGGLRAENRYLREALTVALGLMHDQAKTIERARVYNREQREVIRGLMQVESVGRQERAA